MPVLLALAAVLLALAAAAVLVPVSLLLRYRAGIARRRARPWVSALNTGAFGVSAGLVLLGSAVTNLWVPGALLHAGLGLGAGALLGLFGLRLSRWEATPEGLHYTPNRWLVLALVLVVAGRLLYGLWRAWAAWGTTPDAASWAGEAGLAGSLAAGALVVGYSLAYWAGLWRRQRRHARAW